MLESIHGRARIGILGPDGELFNPSSWYHNDVMYDAATIMGQRLITDSPNYKIAFMYIEFENVASPGNPISPPLIYRSAGLSYYNGLASSPNIDYLRVPIISGVLSSSNIDSFPHGNVVTFFAQTQGVTGVHGKPFNNASNSKVFGGALVASPDPNDATQDLIFARMYYGASDQQVKASTSAQIGIQWQETLG